MSILDKAINILSCVNFSGRDLHPRQAQAIAATLKAAGLLAPDLPAYSEADADSAWWYAATYGIGVGRLSKASPLRIMLWDSEPGGVLYTDIDSAREYALKILAACEHAEKEQGNGHE